jgi:hypothetical protein
MPQYNRTNPSATMATRYAEQAPSRRAYEQAEFEQRRKRETDAKLDAALRKPLQGSALSGISADTLVPQTPQTGPAPQPARPPARQPGVVDQQVSNLAQIPGGGAMASKMHAGQAASRKKQEDQVWDLLKEGTLKNQPDLIRNAKLQAQQLGLDIPPAFFDDPEVRSEMVRVIDAAKSAGMNEQQIGTVVNTFLQKNPQLVAKIAQGYQTGRGMPEALQAGQELAITQDKQKELRQKGGATMHLVDKISKEFGVPWPKAYEIYNTSKGDPQKMIANLYAKELRERARSGLDPSFPEWETDEQIIERVTKAITDIYQRQVPNIGGRYGQGQDSDPAGIMGGAGGGQPFNGRGALNVP